MITRLIAVLLLTALPVGVSAADDGAFGAYHALVIGINEYDDEGLTRLETAVNDASAMHDLLQRKYGFESRLLLNPSRYELVRALDELRNDLGWSDNLLIYYAGHGQLDTASDTGYWLPADAEADNRANWIPVHTITSNLKALAARNVLVVADSCYSGTLTRDASAPPPDGAARMAQMQRLASKRGRHVLSSGGLEPVYDGGGDGHSVFARAILSILRENGQMLDGLTLSIQVREQVMIAAAQTPEYGAIRLTDHEGGDFIFLPKGSIIVGGGGDQAAPSQASIELTFWQSIKDGADPADFEAYLLQYPDGNFAALARNRLARLKSDVVRPSDFEGRWLSDSHSLDDGEVESARYAFEFVVIGDRLGGSVTRNGQTKGLLDGRIVGNSISFRTVYVVSRFVRPAEFEEGQVKPAVFETSEKSMYFSGELTGGRIRFMTQDESGDRPDFFMADRAQ